MENLKIKYVTLKEKLVVKSIEANRAIEKFEEVKGKADKVDERLVVLREELEKLEEQKEKAIERNIQLKNRLNEVTYNTEELRHTHLHLTTKDGFVAEHRQLLQNQKQRFQEKEKDENAKIDQLTSETDTIQDKLIIEKDRMKVAFRRVKDLEESLSDLVDEMRMKKQKENENYDHEDESNERTYQIKLLVKQAVVRAEHYEAMEQELEKILNQSEDDCDEVKQRFLQTRIKLDELITEIQEM